jgi:phosphoglucomutase
MKIRAVATKPIEGQEPGTSGLRKPVAEFQEPSYIENFVQSVFDATAGRSSTTLVVGGDGRFFNREAIQVILKMALANGLSRILVGRGGLLSTPAASCLIRKHGAAGGLVASASHNPGGPEGDFGIKFNSENGAPAPPRLTEEIARRTKAISSYRIAEVADFDLDRLGTVQMNGAAVEVIDPVADYAELMQAVIDFDLIARLFASGFRMRFDAMNAVTGPYAKAILEQQLGAPAETVVNATPLPDFGGLHPDPTPAHARELVQLMMGADSPDFGAASDGDGDRNMIVAPGMVVGPSDSLALLAANIHLAPGYARGLTGVARSMPTSRAVDRVAWKRGVPCYETPTGWKFFASLLDAGLINLCGEESAGTGSDHVREKDGLWAVLLWLNVIAARGLPIGEIVREHWAAFGRDYYQRYDYEELDPGAANELMKQVRAKLPSLPGKLCGRLTVEASDDFSYTDPVDGSKASSQGIRIFFREGARIACRLSGTGTRGATLRLYLERHEADPSRHGKDPSMFLADVAAAAEAILTIRHFTGRSKPTAVV